MEGMSEAMVKQTRKLLIRFWLGLLTSQELGAQIAEAHWEHNSEYVKHLTYADLVGRQNSQ